MNRGPFPFETDHLSRKVGFNFESYPIPNILR